MRHGNAFNKLSRSPEKRARMMRSLVTHLLLHERILTTTPRAKSLRPLVERLITRARSAPANILARHINLPAVVSKLQGELTDRYRSRSGGYTRIWPAGRRDSDCAPVSVIELLDSPFEMKTVFEKFKEKSPPLKTRPYPTPFVFSTRPLLNLLKPTTYEHRGCQQTLLSYPNLSIPSAINPPPYSGINFYCHGNIGRRFLSLTGMTVATSAMRILPKLNFNLKPDEILNLTRLVLEKCVTELDRVGAVPAPQCTFQNVIWPLSQLETTVRTELSAATFLQYVSPVDAVRDASVEATKLIDQYSIDKETREDLFNVTKCVYENKTEMASLDNESRRLVDKMLLEFKHNGLGLPAEKRSELKTKRKRLAELGVEFSKNMNEDKTEMLLTGEELEGCPSDFIEGLEQRDGKYVLTMKYPDVFGVLKNAKREEVRQRMDIAFNSRCRINAPLLEEAVQLRFECAKLLGYASHAEFQLEERLAKSHKAVLEFESDLRAKLTPLAKEELNKLKKWKKNETSRDDFYSWDYHVLEKEYAIDNEKLKEYYSLDMVMDEMLKIYEEVLSLKFTHVADGPIWHADVRLYEVTDRESGEMVGHIYLDLFPRDGKYTHAACFDVQPGCIMDIQTQSNRQYPAAAMVANFSKPTTGKPSLLKHDEVVTLFHELGHAMHDMCAKTKYSRFHGTSVETDFVEAPSQMLENMLKRIARHYLRPTETLTDDFIAQLVRAKNFNAGLLNLRQVFFGLFDMTIHSIQAPIKEALNNETIDQLYARLRAEIALIPQPDNVTPASSFGHMMGGYDAGYYGYLWSQVFSADMFYSRFKKEGLQSSKVGLDYRYKILGPGGSRYGIMCAA
ncbi:Neurolysin/Thimet oligopeptidase 2 domain-containing protein [Paramicrosporidium saccamoebae]|uniref:Neurolysin/Thimet oligopeptidase 2 domain-containing protein n=1 Tax=Paramicrosporidium saccamoebae TaxID=1246581 RepID=A0A2H9TFT2_9FUNG|nr:Neurolysin/Thimet oligopeptidase 2 domain-containing protein [Paramicrosporidium saccamoebae]